MKAKLGRRSRADRRDRVESESGHKSQWLLDHVQCPGCHSAALSVEADAITCDRCGRRHSIVDGTFNFIDSDVIASFDLAETDAVSDHPFDGNALAIIDRCREAKGMVLDCGSGYKSVALPNVVQMDIVPFPNVDVLGVNQTIPFRDSSFDAVFSLDVLEHVNDPFASASEIIRVLRPGGVLYLDLPFLQVEHGYPHHYFNATRMGVQQLFSQLECLGHHVPASGQPMFMVHHVLSLYREGLPSDLRSRFETMTVEDLLQKSPSEWLDDSLVQELDDGTRWVIASTTQALFRKSAVAAGNGSSTLAVSTSDLPGFA